jgi:hypothetical protein
MNITQKLVNVINKNEHPINSPLKSLLQNVGAIH